MPGHRSRAVSQSRTDAIMAADKLVQAYRRSVLLIALASFSSKNANRDLLRAGSSTPISCEVAGTIGRAKHSFDFAGSLEVGQPSIVNSSSAAPTADVLAFVLAEIPPARRVSMLDAAAKAYVRSGGKLPVDGEARAEAEVWLKTLRQAKPQNRAGSVSFTVHE